MSAKVALIGYGLAGEAFHAPLIGTEPNLELAAVVTHMTTINCSLFIVQLLARLWAVQKRKSSFIGKTVRAYPANPAGQPQKLRKK